MIVLVSGVALSAGMGFGGEGNIKSPTFASDVAAILYQHCTGCHRPGQAAPFTLTSYDEVRKRGRQIAEVTADRFMPPWKLTQSDFPLLYDRRLSADQIEILRAWVDAGMPRGEVSSEPLPPSFDSDWGLGEPDLVVGMKEAFAVSPEGPDVYRNFVLPLPLREDRWVRAIDFRPGAPGVVHHSLFFFDATGASRELDEEDPLPGYGNRMGLVPRGRRGGGRFAALNIGGAQEESASFGGLGGWAVGGNPQPLPEGLAYRLPAGADLILSTHFHPSGKEEKEVSNVGLYFAKSVPTNRFAALILPPLFGALAGIDIPAGATNYSIEDSFVLPVDAKAFGLGAHAHYLGREMKMTAHQPNGEIRLVGWIQDWDFSWQERYRFAEEVFLPAGTRLEVKVSYDNSEGNPRNPSHPPKRVRWGEGSNDEMGSMTLLLVATHPADHSKLQLAYRSHIRDAFRDRVGKGMRRFNRPMP